MRELPIAARLYVVAVIVCAGLLAAFAIGEVGDWPPIILFTILYIAVDSFPVGISATRIRTMTVTVTTPVAIAAAIALGPAGVTLVALGTLLDFRSMAPVKRLFNAAQLLIAGFLTALTYLVLGGEPVLTTSSFPAVFIPASVAGMVYLACNFILVGLILVLAEGERWRQIVRDALSRVAPPGVAYAGLALVIAVLWETVGGLAILLGLVPLLVARWAVNQFAEEQDAYRATIATLVQAVETKDLYTRGHSERVARASVMIGKSIGMSDERLQTLEYAGTLHDVGKLGVPTAVLQKSGKLTDDEFDAIKLHPTRGHDIVREIRFLDEALDGIYHHHERMDGRGYPSGLTGDQIPEFARVISVADAFDSMTSTRSYRSARSIGEALSELERCKGSQFDPGMVDALVAAVEADGWLPAVPPSNEELRATESVVAFDDDDPMLSTGLIR